MKKPKSCSQQDGFCKKEWDENCTKNSESFTVMLPNIRNEPSIDNSKIKWTRTRTNTKASKNLQTLRSLLLPGDQKTRHKNQLFLSFVFKFHIPVLLWAQRFCFILCLEIPDQWMSSSCQSRVTNLTPTPLMVLKQTVVRISWYFQLHQCFKHNAYSYGSIM